MSSFQRPSSDTRIYIFIVVVSLFCVLTPLSRATAPTLSLSVVNNSQKEIRHLFLSSAASDNWGDDLLSASIAAGGSSSVNADWGESTVKVVAEDEDGCFLTTTLNTAGTPSWTITNDTPRNCGF